MLSDSDDEEFQQSSGGGKELQNALHMAVGTICRQQDISTNDITSAGQTPQTSNEAIECITQMTFHYATKCLAKDLVAFCKHANRKTITVDDVKLVARKNPRGLLDSLDGFCDNSTSNLKERKRTNIMGSNVNIGMGVGINNTAGGKQNNPKRDAMYDDSSSDDGLDALSRVIQSKRRKQSSDSSAGLGIDLQIGSSGSSSSDSDDSGMKVKSSHSQHTFKTLVKQNKNLNIQDEDESSSDDGVDNQTSTNIGGRKGNSSAPIELEDSDPD